MIGDGTGAGGARVTALAICIGAYPGLVVGGGASAAASGRKGLGLELDMIACSCSDEDDVAPGGCSAGIGGDGGIEGMRSGATSGSGGASAGCDGRAEGGAGADGKEVERNLSTADKTLHCRCEGGGERCGVGGA
jgi:hypothetical protein